MRKLVLLTVALLLVMMPAHALAGTNVFSAWGGWQFTNEDELNDGWKAGVAYEYRLDMTGMPIQIGLELPFNYITLEEDNTNSDVEQYTFIPTIKGYFTGIPMLTPYAGIGIGYARTDIDRTGADSQDSFAFKAVAGAEAQIIPASPILVFGEWEYNWIEVDDDAIAGAGDSPDVGGNAIQAGVRFRW